MKIAVTGASGFVGKNFIDYVLNYTEHDVVALSRSEFVSSHKRLETRKVDLYSLLDCEKALEGCDVAIYLVHSMSPSSRLSQGEFQDFDFILADNFAKAASRCRLKHIVYVGGIIPKVDNLSIHLKSRLEVEETLHSHSTPVTTLRCGLVIGKNGSSFRIIERLIDRLPIIGLPVWTNTKLQAVYVKDLVYLMTQILHIGPRLAGSYDVGAPEHIEYRDLLLGAVKVKKKKNIFISINFITSGLSKFWVTLITRVPKGLVYPLVDSLKHSMVSAKDRALPEELDIDYVPLMDALRLGLVEDQEPNLPMQNIKSNNRKKTSLVQSVQRLPCPENWQMKDVALYYMKWTPKFFRPFLIIEEQGSKLFFRVKFLKQPILVLKFSKKRTFPGRELFYIIGGLLNIPHPKARLEFRELSDKKHLIIAIHSYKPRLPWLIYEYTQAQLHRFVMWRFGLSLAKK
jgi:uncharacterized protein YbjT (DUF2867 family)